MSSIWDELARRHHLHKRLVRACRGVMSTCDLSEQTVAEALGKRTGATLFGLHSESALLIRDAGTLVDLAQDRWSGFQEPPELVAARAELAAAIDEVLAS